VKVDFVSQGWPGTGTSGDPYLISGLSIVYSSGTPSISISDTTSYFVIRDCYIEQGSTMQAIYLSNATHGTIEHNTMISDGGGIFFMDSNFTHVSHNDISNYGGGMFESSIVALSSWDCEIERNLCYTDNNLGSYFWYCPNVILNYNSWEVGISGPPVMVIGSCNDTVANHNTILGGDVGLILDSSHNVQINNLTVYTNSDGLVIANCPWFELTNSHIEGPGVGFEMSASPNVTIADSYVESYSSPPIGIILSDDLTISGNTIEGGDGYGIYLDTCQDSAVEDNTLLNCGPEALFLSGCDDAYIAGNIIDGPCDTGISLIFSDRAVVESNYIDTYYGDYGIYIDTSYDGIATGNTLIDSFVGMFFGGSANWTFSDSTATGCFIGFLGDTTALMYGYNNYVSMSMAGLIFDDITTGEFIGNEISEVEMGFGLFEAIDVYVYDNTVDICDSGIYSELSINLTCISNEITNCEFAGIDLYGASDGEVIGNTVSSPFDGGIIFDNCLGFNITDNVLTDCGIVFDTGGSLAEYNHTFSNNLVNGQSIYYSVNEESATIDPTSYGQIILVNCTDIDVTGKTWGSVTIPIQLYYCAAIEIDDVTTTSNKYGIQAYQSDNVNITDITSSGDESSADLLYIWTLAFTSILKVLSRMAEITVLAYTTLIMVHSICALLINHHMGSMPHPQMTWIY